MVSFMREMMRGGGSEGKFSSLYISPKWYLSYMEIGKKRKWCVFIFSFIIFYTFTFCILILFIFTLYILCSISYLLSFIYYSFILLLYITGMILFIYYDNDILCIGKGRGCDVKEKREKSLQRRKGLMWGFWLTDQDYRGGVFYLPRFSAPRSGVTVNICFAFFIL